MLENLNDLDGQNGFRILGAAAGDASGTSVQSIGDINGDGLDDLAIGAPNANPNGLDSSGATYIVYGSTDGFPLDLDLSFLNGVNGFRIDGAAEGDRSGAHVANAGDLNGDGFDDVLIGARGSDLFVNLPNFGSSGAGFVVFGSDSFNSNLNLRDLNGTNGHRKVN